MRVVSETASAPSGDSGATVFVVDDDYALRDALRLLLESEGFSVEVFASANAFIDACGQGRRGCAILDVGLPDMDGLALQQLLTERGISMPVIILTGQGDVPKAVQALKAGAVDFLEKPADTEQLLAHVSAALAQDADRQAREKQRSELAGRLDTLTSREREIMVMVTSGLSSKEIARRLDISFRTVEGYRQRVRDKMQAGSLPELVDMARICGLIR
jgi:FixJ family two-component response regulator